MKQGKCPTRKQAEVIQSRRLNPHNWFVIKDLSNMMEIRHRESLKVQIIYK